MADATLIGAPPSYVSHGNSNDPYARLQSHPVPSIPRHLSSPSSIPRDGTLHAEPLLHSTSDSSVPIVSTLWTNVERLGGPQFIPVAEESPPDYAAARRPTEPITYTFSPISYNGTVLLPPPTAQDSRPQYHIATVMNCFVPTSHITIITRGGAGDGELVGRFEMGISNAVPRVILRGKSLELKNILNKHSKRDVWNFSVPKEQTSDSRVQFVWICAKSPNVCVSSMSNGPDQIVYAKFLSINPLNSFQENKDGIARLTIMPEGQPFLDEILLSIMLIERKRLTQDTSARKPTDLFNF